MTSVPSHGRARPELAVALRHFGQRAAVGALLQAVWFLFLVRMPIQAACLASPKDASWLRWVSDSTWLFIGWPVVTELLRGPPPTSVCDAEDRRRALAAHRVERSRLAMLMAIPTLYGGFLVVNWAAAALGRGDGLLFVGCAPGIALLIGAFLAGPLLAFVDLVRNSTSISRRVRIVEADGRYVLVELSGGERRLLDARSLSGSAARGLVPEQRPWLSGGRFASSGTARSSPYRDHDAAWTDVRVETFGGRLRRLREALAHLIDLAGYAVAPAIWALGGYSLLLGAR